MSEKTLSDLKATRDAAIQCADAMRRFCGSGQLAWMNAKISADELNDCTAIDSFHRMAVSNLGEMARRLRMGLDRLSSDVVFAIAEANPGQARTWQGLRYATASETAVYGLRVLLTLVGLAVEEALNPEHALELVAAHGDRWIENPESLADVFSRIAGDYRSLWEAVMRKVGELTLPDVQAADIVHETAGAIAATNGGNGGNGGERRSQAAGTRANVNARMLDTLQKNPDCRGWTCKQWAQHLKCAKPSIVATPAWKELAMAREALKAEKSRDRRRRGPKRKPKA